MKLQELAAIKAQVRAVNASFSWMSEPIELWFPHMFSDGKWACSLVFSKVVDRKVLMEFLPMLESLGLSWFIHEVNGDITIAVL